MIITVYEVVMLDHRIHTFVTLYKEMNYRKTAQLLNMTQPGVTQHIQYLEKHYGVRLFEYDGRRLQRTRHAEALKAHADSVLAREKNMIHAFSSGETVHLDVGATKTIGEFVLVDALNHYLTASRNSIRFEIDNTENLLTMLENSTLDFAVIEGVFDKQKYGYHLFKKERFVGICAAGHPFAGKTVPLSAAFHETLIVREPGSGTRRLLEQAVMDRGFSLDAFSRCICISHFPVITSIVTGSSAITFGYMPVASHHKELATFEIEDMHISGEFNFVYCNEDIAREKNQSFLQSVNLCVMFSCECLHVSSSRTVFASVRRSHGAGTHNHRMP